MKKSFLFCVAALMIAAVPVSMADSKTSSSKAKTSKSSKEEKEHEYRPGFAPVQKSVKALKFKNARVNTKAEYYIYLESASWCGPCKQEMPEIAKQYDKMKKDGRIELILISADRSEKAAEKFVEDNDGKFPIVMGTEKKLAKLVSYTKAKGIPHATFVDKEGNILKEGHGSIVKDWESVIDQADAAAAGDEESEQD